jgi:hypothetical protein
MPLGKTTMTKKIQMGMRMRMKKTKRTYSLTLRQPLKADPPITTFQPAPRPSSSPSVLGLLDLTLFALSISLIILLLSPIIMRSRKLLPASIRSDWTISIR